MNTASLELCKELYELSWWDNDRTLTWQHVKRSVHNDEWEELGSEDRVLDHHQIKDYNWENKHDAVYSEFICPAYDIGYLMRKLPDSIWSDKYEQKASLWTRKNLSDYSVWYWVGNSKDGSGTSSEYSAVADTPENALCRLAIELFKTGILKREGR